MSSSKSKPSGSLLLILSAFALLAAIYFWTRQHNAPDTPLISRVTNSASNAPASPPIATAEIRTNPLLSDVCRELALDADPTLDRQKLAALRKKLETMPVGMAVKLIRDFLDSKADAHTGLGFKLASNGTLDEAPTLRTFLLDELGRLDPAAAADYSKVILASMDSPDEWAVALRNLALGDTNAEGSTLLAQKTTQMLEYAPWQQNPSTGYLEAFDVPVFLGGTNFIPTLTDLVRSQDNPAIAHAAFLALDRLVINHPAQVLQAIQADPDSMEGRESTRADFFARADVGDPQQRQILENYLLDPDITPAELQTFAGIFPNANYMISPNLLTQSITPNRSTLANRDAQSLTVAQQWLNDPAFAAITPEVQTIIQRLQNFATQARSGQ